MPVNTRQATRSARRTAALEKAPLPFSKHGSPGITTPVNGSTSGGSDRQLTRATNLGDNRAGATRRGRERRTIRATPSRHASNSRTSKEKGSQASHLAPPPHCNLQLQDTVTEKHRALVTTPRNYDLGAPETRGIQIVNKPLESKNNKNNVKATIVEVISYDSRDGIQTKLMSTPMPVPLPTRPDKVYRGNDPIKRAVSNPKLRAIFAGHKIPGLTAKKAGDMALRMGSKGNMRMT